MRANHIKGWLAEARKKERYEEAAEKKSAAEGRKEVLDRTGEEGMEGRRGKTPTEMSNWERVVDLVQTVFGEGRLAEENTWQAVILIPKGKREYRGAILKGYRRRRAEEAGKEVERFLGSDPPLHREAWHWMKGWYRAAVDRAPPPARVTFERITADRVDL